MVGDDFEATPDPAVDGVDPPCQLDLDRLGVWAPEGNDEVWQFVGGAAQVGRARHWVIEQRRRRRGFAVDRALWAAVGCELHPGADRADVGLVEELRPR